MSLTCGVCPGTEFTCTCSVESDGLAWRLPESVTITLDDKAGVGSNETTTNGMFVAVVTHNTGGKESMLIYTATDHESLVNGTIKCEEQSTGRDRPRSASVTINNTFAG